MTSNRTQVLDQFTRQAVPFSNAPGIRDADALQLLVQVSEVRAHESVLDVACGPGLVVSAFAKVAARVTGVDLTPAMIARAREVASEFDNVQLDLADVTRLPYPDASFDLVVSRFSVHHFPEPLRVLHEMLRVCRPSGRLLICDLLASDEPSKAAAFHRLECARDPSHARALTLAELRACMREAGMRPELVATYRLPFELDALVSRSFPANGDRAWLKEQYLAALPDDAFGLHLARVGDEVHGAYDVAVLLAPHPAA